MPQFVTIEDLRRLESTLLGRTNIRPRSITEDKLAVGAASAAVVRDGSISDVHIGTLTLDALTVNGSMQSSNYSAGTAGWIINASGTAEFYELSVIADIEGGTLSIGTSPNWFRVDSSGNIWSGNATFAGAQANQFAVTNAGAVSASDITITGGSLNINSGAFVVTSGGALTATDITVTGGSMNIGSGSFIVTTGGAVTADSITLEGWVTTSTGGGYRTAVSGQRVTITESDANRVTFYSGSGSEVTPGYIEESVSGGARTLDIRAASLGSPYAHYTGRFLATGSTASTTSTATVIGNEVFLIGEEGISIRFGSGANEVLSADWDATGNISFTPGGLTNAGYVRIATSNDSGIRLQDSSTTTNPTTYVRFEADDGNADAFMGLVAGALRVQNQVTGEDIEFWTQANVRGYVRAAGYLEWTDGTDVSLSANSGYVLVGTSGGAHMAIDTNEVQAKSSGTAATTLNLNILGGTVQVGSATLTQTIDLRTDTINFSRDDVQFTVGDSTTPAGATASIYRAANGFALSVYNKTDLGTTGPDGIVVELGTDTDDPGNDDRFFVCRKGDGTVVGGIRGNGATGGGVELWTENT